LFLQKSIVNKLMPCAWLSIRAIGIELSRFLGVKILVDYYNNPESPVPEKHAYYYKKNFYLSRKIRPTHGRRLGAEFGGTETKFRGPNFRMTLFSKKNSILKPNFSDDLF